MSKKLRIGIVYGGRSGEHDVSLQTAFSVIQNFDFTKYELIPFYITKHGEWRSGAALASPAHTKDQLLLNRPGHESGRERALLPLFGLLSGVRNAADANNLAVIHGERVNTTNEIDVMLPLLHGTFGEDGTIQGMFEMAGIPYVGAGVLASAAGMDKAAMKSMFAQAGLPQCVYRAFNRRQWEKDTAFYTMEVETALGYPCFVKPANLGSSVGISKVKNRTEFIAAVMEAFKYDRKVLVEEFIDGREIEVSVLGNDEPIASVPGEVVSSNEFYDYRAKYIDGKSGMIIPAEVDDTVKEQLQEMALRAFGAIDGSGLSRVDFFLRKSDGSILINEINTMPGFTPFSMYPLLWKESGKSYRELLDDLIRLAVERHEERQKLDYGNAPDA